jgi:iron complex outermembrane recepter protein
MATALNTIPGVSMQSGTYATNRIVIRGMGSRTPYNTNRIRSYLNDIPITTSDGISAPEEIDQLSLGRIEVLRGPSSALYGSGLGGSINLFTPEKLQNEGVLSLNYGSFNTLRTNLSGTVNTKNTNLWGSLSHLQSDGYRANNEYNRTSFITTAKWKQPKWSLKSTLMLTGVDGEIPSSLGKTQFEKDPEAAAPAWAAIEGYKKNRKAMAGITLTNILSSKLTNQFTIHGKWSDNFEKRPFNNLGDQTLSTGIRNKLSYYRPLTDWVLGIDWIAEQYKWKLDKDDLLLNENRENRNQFSVFSIMNYRPTFRLSLSLAGTLNHISYNLTDLYATNGDQSGKRDFPYDCFSANRVELCSR